MSQIGYTKTFDLGDGRIVSIETGRLAKQADGSAVIKVGNNMLLATIVSDKEAKEGVDFLPLTIEYQERYASTGRFPGGFFKREARPTENEILTMRLVDRALRPLFPKDYHAGTQVVINLISSDRETLPDSYACLAASAAIAVSDVPIKEMISEVRVVRVDGQFKLNPTIAEVEACDIDMIIAATESSVVMVEGEMNEVSEEEMADTIKFAHEAIKVQVKALNELAKEINAPAKREYNHENNDADFEKEVVDALYSDFLEAMKNNFGKAERREALKTIKDAYLEKFSDEEKAEKAEMFGRYIHTAEKKAARDLVLKYQVRLDGRKTDEIRPIWSEVDYLPSAHGSAVFTRGETQSLTTVTLGSKMDQQMIDGAVQKGYNKFLLHYNFPAYSTGEARMNRGTSRREVGHGNLANRALKGMLPTDTPYTIRVVSDILESNGSSSMATVCAGTLALMDAGIKLKAPVSGIAMGLISGENGDFAVLSDILGDEDHLGDMDFKVTGTAKGVTAVQMDIKVTGLSYEILLKALSQAKVGRAHILNEMLKTMDAPREDYKPHAPRIVKLEIPKEFIGAVIGPGGKIIQEMQAETGTVIVLEEVDDKGVIDISGENKESIDQAIARIKAITAVPDVGEEYDGVVKSIMPYGAFVEFMPGKQGLLHISEISWERLNSLDGILSEGDTVRIKLLDVDERSGKFRLSRKVLLPKPERADNGKAE